MPNVPIVENFVENLRGMCQRNGISQRELSRLSDVHWTTINRIFSGTLEPSLTTCEKLAGAAGLDAEKIFRRPQKRACKA